MSRPLRSLRPLLWPAFVLLALLQCVLILELLFSPDPLRESFIFLHVVFTALVAVPYGWRFRWLLRFCRHVQRFATIENPRIVLHYDPQLKRGENLSDLLQSCQKELDNLAGWFGSPLRGRLTVFLFTHWKDISAIFGPGYAGTALFQANAIVLANDNRVPEVLRHELTHLFAFRWSLFAPPLLSEGIAVWLQGCFWGRSIDDEARTLILRGSPRLSRLLRSRFFFAEPQRRSCYILAGSFTGFLIRRYGWDRYRKLYRGCDGFRFAARFQKCFGISLAKADWQWRNEVMVMPILNRRLGRKPHC
jgi:hypothetical protein